jgi:hypothetical protein
VKLLLALACSPLAFLWLFDYPIAFRDVGFLLLGSEFVPLLADLAEEKFLRLADFDARDRRPFRVIGALDVGSSTWLLRHQRKFEALAFCLVEVELFAKELVLVAKLPD